MEVPVGAVEERRQPSTEDGSAMLSLESSGLLQRMDVLVVVVVVAVVVLLLLLLLVNTRRRFSRRGRTGAATARSLVIGALVSSEKDEDAAVDCLSGDSSGEEEDILII